MTNSEPTPSKPAAIIILVSIISYGVLSKLVFPSFGITPLVNMGIWIGWILLTAWYLIQTGNARIARLYLLVMFGMMLFVWLAIYFYQG